VRETRDALDDRSTQTEPIPADAHQPGVLPAPEPQQAGARPERVGGEDEVEEAELVVAASRRPWVADPDSRIP